MVEYLIGSITTALELAGIAAIAVGTGWASAIAGRRALARGAKGPVYERYRQDLSRGILLGLELLVAADIIGTLVVEPTLMNVGVLALIVLVRTFLSFTLEVEVSGRWPWQTALQGPARGDATLDGSQRPG